MENALKTSPFRRRVAAVRERVEPHLPRDRLVEIAAYHAERPFGRHKPHYVDFEHALAKGYEDIVHANLDLVSGLRILDIGTGTGYLPFSLERLGHHVTATEVPVDESMTWKHGDPSGRSLYGDFCEAYGLRRLRWAVEARKPAPAGLFGFDAIFARSLYFNYHGKTGETWTPEDWRFFLDDMAGRMATDTSILFLSFLGEHRSLRAVLDLPADAESPATAVQRTLTRLEIRDRIRRSG